MTRRLIPLIIVVVLTLILAFVVQDFVRDVIVVPVVYAVWIIWLALTNLPQWIFWGLLALVTLILAVRSLRGVPQPPAKARPNSEFAQGAVTPWARRLNDAPARASSRWRVARDLGRIFWETRFPDEAFHLQGFLETINRPEMAMPSEIRAYFEAGLARPEPAYRSWFSLRRDKKASPLDLDPAVVVAFLEETLEIGH